MRTASCSDICNFSSPHALRSKSNLRSGCLAVFSETHLPHSVASFIPAPSPSPQRLPPRSRQREKKVYQIFLSSFTLNCLWVGFPAPVGPLLIPHRTLCLSVMNPPPPPPNLQPPPSSSLTLEVSLLVKLSSHLLNTPTHILNPADVAYFHHPRIIFLLCVFSPSLDLT